MSPRRRRRHLTSHLVVVTVAITLGVAAFLLIRYETPADRFRGLANGLCRESKHGIEVASQATLSEESTPAQIAAFIEDVLVPELRDRVTALRALEGGDGLDERLAPVLDDYEVVIDEVAADATAAVGSDDPFRAVDRRLDALGLEDCGSAPAA